MDNWAHFNGTYGGGYHLHAQTWLNSQNAAAGTNGQSSIHLRVYLAKDSGYSYSGVAYFNAQGRINGAQVATGTFPTTLGSGAGTWIAIDWDGTYNHDVNGNLYISGGASAQNAWGGVGSAGGDWAWGYMPRLARSPTISGISVSLIKPTTARIAGTLSSYGNGTSGTVTGYYRLVGAPSWTDMGNQAYSGSNAWNLTGLKPGKDYQYTMNAWNNNGDVAYGTYYTFKTKGIAGHTPLLARLA